MKYYTSIKDLPIYNFNEIIETGDFKHLVKEGTLDNKSNIVWDEILEEFTEYVGFPQSYIEYMAYSRKAALLICQAYLENKMYLIAFARIAEIQALEALGENTQDFNKSLAIVSKYMGYRIDTKVTTVKEFYGIIKEMEDGKKNNVQ